MMSEKKRLIIGIERRGIISPPVPAFYNQPKNIEDLINHSVGRVLDLFDIDLGIVHRWK